ncbi:MAG: hypothetical protein JW841_15675 [Deltaproteobacteria bacterium]|nr:hypothetical protein [Deltaproteobacteria bacterium]
MKKCDFPEELLSAYADGEAGKRHYECMRHLAQCSECRETINSQQKRSKSLISLVDQGVGDLDPLVALTRIRAKINKREQRQLGNKLLDFWHDLITFHRRALAGIALAMGIGALSAPLVVLWASNHLQNNGNSVSTKFAGVIIESLQCDGAKQAIVRHNSDYSTTLIWVEPDATTNENTP